MRQWDELCRLAKDGAGRREGHLKRLVRVILLKLGLNLKLAWEGPGAIAFPFMLSVSDVALDARC